MHFNIFRRIRNSFCYPISKQSRYLTTIFPCISDQILKNQSLYSGIINSDGSFVSYRDINLLVNEHVSNIKLKNRRLKFIAGYVKPHSNFVVAMLMSWQLGACFVPLSTSLPKHTLQLLLNDCQADLIVCSEDFPYPDIAIPTYSFSDNSNYPDRKNIPCQSPEMKKIGMDDNAVLIFTSGTTGKPKGVLHTYSGIQTMMQSLIQSWKYTHNDYILHFLPLNHMHGLLNKLLCMLYVGGNVEFLPSASPSVIWNRLALTQSPIPNLDNRNVTLFMAVPTVYSKLLELFPALPTPQQTLIIQNFASIRLFVSGSAACPIPIMDAWKLLTSQDILERYGMSEFGMALSNPYEKKDGERIPGCVGLPLPFVQCRVVNDNEEEIDYTTKQNNNNNNNESSNNNHHDNSESRYVGELRVKGPNVFRGYLNLPTVTAESFDDQGWFKTGDTVTRESNGYYKILGRTSVDIIKCGGFKLSALEIETALLSHPEVQEVAVIGIPDSILGEKPIAIITKKRTPTTTTTTTTSTSSNCDNNTTTTIIGTSSGNDPRTPLSSSKIVEQEESTVRSELNLLAIRTFLSTLLPAYSHPRAVYVVPDIPRNALGKV